MRRACLVMLALLALAAPAAAQVTVRSSVTATRVGLGDSFDWVVSVDGAMGAEEPVVPAIDFARIEYNGSSQEMSFVNGQMSARTAFQFHVTPSRTGRFQIPAVTVRAKGGVYTTDPIAIEVTPPQPGSHPALTDEAGHPRLRLVASAAPRSVVVGEPVIYTIRIYQGTRLIGDTQYRAPATPRFYVEPTGPGNTAYEGSGPDRWLVGERRTILYPTVSGRLTIGPAMMACLVPSLSDPDGVEVDLTSEPVTIEVHPLPPAPAGFQGAVADAHLSGAIDRMRVRADEALQVTFRLAGTGNLRLAAPPAFDDLPDFTIFDRKVEDSLAVEEGSPSGTKVVRYTLLPRRPGMLTLPPLRYVVFVPSEHAYRTLEWAGATIEVLPGLGKGPAAGGAKFALVPTASPGGSPLRAARPWAAAALLALALAFALPRLVPRGPGEGAPGASARAAESDAMLARLEEARARGDVREFWRRAEAALALAPEGAEPLRVEIAHARYAPGGGSPAEMDAIYGRVAELLRTERSRARAQAKTRAPLGVRIATLALLVLGLGLAGMGAARVLGAPGDSELQARLGQASAALAGGARPQAESALIALWNEGARRPGVALDLAIAAFYDRRLGEAALWTERARRLDPRHPLVHAMERALTQEGAWEGLPTGMRAETTGGELAFAACVLGALGIVLLSFRRRVPRIAGTLALVLGAALGIVSGQSGAAGEAPGRGIVLSETALADRPGGTGDVTLEAGRAVWLEGASGGWTRVRAGSQVSGFIPTNRVRAI